MLAKGGSAADAALAMLLALTVVEPQSSGIGGGGFLVYSDARTGEVTTIDGRETAPAGATPELFLDAAGKPLPFREAVEGGSSVGVPGNLRLMALAHRRFGRLPWATLFEPAIRLARDGFVISPRLERELARHQAMLARSAAARALYYRPDGSPRPAGTLLCNPKLAALLQTIAREGPDRFYEGGPATRLVQAVRSARNPSTMTAQDVAGYEAKVRPAVCGVYRTYRVCGMGPPSSGGIAVFGILKQVERFDLAALGPGSPLAWHLIGESMRLAYADRAKWVGDPDRVAVPVAGLVDPAYLESRAARISPGRAMPSPDAGRPPGAPPAMVALPDPEGSGTTHFVAADARGNVASLTSTIEDVFGSGLIVDGYVLNNELTDFNFEPTTAGRPAANRVEGGKRPRSSMSPTIVFDAAGRPLAAVGAAGGSTIIAQVAKTLIGLLDWGLPVEQAIGLPVIMGVGDQLFVEPGTSLAGMTPALEAMGHSVVPRLSSKMNGLERVGDAWRGGTDPRGDGSAKALEPGAATH